MSVLSNLEPHDVFKYFEEICNIPHGSGSTKKISDYLVDFAKKHNLKYSQDKYNNVIIWKKGTKGYEDSAPVMIQGHMDMVCEKDADFDIDMENEGLKLRYDNGIISADGTTLGGDDGIAVAYALAILASDTIPHPPLEAVFTVDEEIGMLGAAAIDCSPLKSHIMLNLDSEDEGYLLVSCAGGITATAHLPYETENKYGTTAALTVTGLIGGHSGVEIDKERANSNHLMGRTLYMLSKKYPFNLISVNGGSKDNAIPRETTASIMFPPETDIDSVSPYISEINGIYSNEYRITDPDIKVTLTSDISCDKEVMTDSSTQKAITMLVNLPGGIQRMSKEIEGLVQTSLNMGILITTPDEIKASFSVRSNVESEKEELVDRIECLLTSLGGSVSCAGNYPAWEYRENSPLRNLMVDVFKEQYGKEPVIQALHAGVECGLFADKIPDLDCVSFGPDMKDIHTTKETMDVESVVRTWNYTLEILKRLK